MTDKIRAYIEHEFAEVPNTRKVQELKEELIINLIEKYNEQIMLGKSEVEAYNSVISSIGDLSELVDSMRVQPFAQPTEKERRRHALFVAGSVVLYILSPFVLILFAALFNEPIIGLLLMFLLVAIATGLLIYNHMTRPTYVKAEDTMVEDFKEWRVQNSRQNSAVNSFRGTFWILVVAVYLLVNFLFGFWAFSWILFIIAAAIDNIVRGVFQMKEDKK